MKDQKELQLLEKEKKAIRELKRKVLEIFPEAEFILYGSKARGDNEEFSDVDILIILDREITRIIEKEIFDIAYDIELENDMVFGLIVESKAFWDSELGRSMPLQWNIDREGIKI